MRGYFDHNYFKIKKDDPQLMMNLYEDNKWFFEEHINSIIFIGLHTRCEEMPIIEEMMKQGKQVLGVEIWRDSCYAIKEDTPMVVLNMDMMEMPEKFVVDAVDMIWIKQTIEHVPKKPAMFMLNQFKRIAKKAVLVETPYGRYDQGTLYNNKYEEHLCALYPEDFAEAGYLHYGAGRPEEDTKHLMGIYVEPKLDEELKKPSYTL